MDTGATAAAAAAAAAAAHAARLAGESANAEVSGPSWFLLKGLLTPEHQHRLFSFLHERDATDWEHLSPCMNPTPKTLALRQQHGAQSAPVLSFGPNDEVAVVEMVQRASEAIGWRRAIKSLTVAAIRYCASGRHPCIGSCFPPHIDHCNDGSWVFLFSLGCAAFFQIKTPGMAERHTFEMKSGDALIFDPSSEAAVLHGVDGVACCAEEAASAGEAELGRDFEDLRQSRFGVQCRVSLVE